MQRILLVWLIIATASMSTPSLGQQLTTFILVRHAEKVTDKSKDPALTSEGNDRAIRLATILEKTTLDAIYTTPYHRTRSTVEPVAKQKGVPVVEYEPQKESVIDGMLAAHAGKTILVSGHSNTIPEIANWLTGSQTFTEFDENDFGNLIIVTVITKGNSKVTWLRY